MRPSGMLPVLVADGGLTGSSTAKHSSKCQSATAFHSRAPSCRDQHFKSEGTRRTVGCYNSPKGCARLWEPAAFFSLSELFLPAPPPLQLPFQPQS